MNPYICDTGIQYDEGLGQRVITTGPGWKGWALLGETDFPYPLEGAEYPPDSEGYALRFLTLDTQDAPGVLYPRFQVGKDDSGRILRIQINDGGVNMDLTGYTVNLFTYRQDTGVVIRNGDAITTSITELTAGRIEYLLDSAKDTAVSLKLKITLTKALTSISLPNDGYVYVDVHDKSSGTGYVKDVTAPNIKIKASGWYGKKILWLFRDAYGNALDLSGCTVEMNYAQLNHAPTFDAMADPGGTTPNYQGYMELTVPNTRFTTSDLYPLFFKITTAHGEIVRVPTVGHYILEVE